MNNQDLLNIELEEYIKTVTMTDEEICALREWVSKRHSVHENPCDAEDGHGNYLDFIDVYRDEKEIENTLEGMTEREKEAFINIHFRDIPDEMPNPMSRKAYLETELIRLRNENAMYKSFIQYKNLKIDFDKYREPKFKFVSEETESLMINREELPFKEVQS